MESREVSPGRPRLSEASGPSPQIRVRVTVEQEENLRTWAELDDRQISQIVREAIDEWGEKHHPKKKAKKK